MSRRRDRRRPEYPPAQHILRDLRLTVEHRPGRHEHRVDAGHAAHLPRVRRAARRRARRSSSTSSAAGSPRSRRGPTGSRPPTSPCTSRPRPVDRRDRGARAGAAPGPHDGRRRGRRCTTAPAASLGLATMSFAVLPRRAENLVDRPGRPVSRMTMATDRTPGFAVAVPRARPAHRRRRGRRARSSSRSATTWRNSLGAIQGGMMAAAADAAAEQARRARAAARRSRPSTSRSRTSRWPRSARSAPGPACSTSTPEFGTAHVEIVDTGAGRPAHDRRDASSPRAP